MNVSALYFYSSILLLAIFAAIALYFLHKWYIKRHSHITKKYATKVFKRRGMIPGWKVLENITLGQGDSTVVADQLVVGPFGVIVACDLYHDGNVYGDLDAEQWILAKGEDGQEKKERIASPYHTAILAVEQLRRLLAKSEIYNVPVEMLVPKTMGQGCYITGSNEYLLTLKALKAQLEKSRYEKDNGVKAEQIAALFIQNK